MTSRGGSVPFLVGFAILLVFCFVNIRHVEAKAVVSPVSSSSIHIISTKTLPLNELPSNSDARNTVQANAQESTAVSSSGDGEKENQETDNKEPGIAKQEEHETGKVENVKAEAITPEEAKEGNVAEAKANSMVCQSKHCYNVAKSIKDALNTSVDPCDNFYEYACGSWVKNNDIPKFHSQYSRISELSNNNEKILMHALNNTEPNDSPNIKKIKTFFQSCMNVDAIDHMGEHPLLQHIKGLGSWAIDKDWNPKEWNFYNTLAKMHREYPAEVFFTPDVHSDPTKAHDKSEFLIMVDQATLNLPQIVYFTSPKIVKTVRNYMTDVICLAGYDKKDVKRKVHELLKFEAKIALISVPKILKKYVRVPLSKLMKAVPEFPWMDHLKKLFAPKEITEDTKVIVLANDYLPKLFELLRNTDKDVLSDYMMWRLVKDVVPLLSNKFRKVHFDLKKKLLGAKHDKPRSTKCFGYTNNILGPLVGALFIREAFSPESKHKVETMMKGIIKAFEARIDQVPWIDKHTNEAVHEKADAVVVKVGYPDYLSDEKQFNQRYENLNITDSVHWFQNVVETDKFASWQTYQKLGSVVPKHHWITVPHLVNAFYVITKNEVVIPSGILQPPFFYPDEIPRSISYGAIGHVLGHELTHGFDTTGRKYDKNGEEIDKRSEAWSKNATKMFHEKAKCLVDQFSKFKVLDKFHLSGTKTLGENIADGGGLKLSFMAFRDLEKEKGPEEILPLLDMPSEKLFFLGYAQKECVHTTPAAEFLAATEDVHPPSKFRVIGTLSNLKEFSEVYKCKPGSYMNPVKKCEVW
ncbi:predicted protein [Nematostella vectensis]|uniref:Endothelin-converting enzyme 1 n=2 Tax=Nematostella vectensis TaxID=45351 RepID=A7RTG6_NEMVE|nr:endothelin-converting enzyme homolog [Nematostella vectensis]EDO45210.1 predicted protein [Nematostella vectensis]|eukprot:XP_001637273.1 predicted protein [Nematostella vectensis]